MKTKLLIGFAVGLILSFIGIFKTDLLCMWIGGLLVGMNISILSLVWIKSEELS
jgi:Na+-translocating ferredoxin:NAD+ oxidoreductase RnfC subunit